MALLQMIHSPFSEFLCDTVLHAVALYVLCDHFDGKHIPAEKEKKLNLIF